MDRRFYSLAGLLLISLSGIGTMAQQRHGLSEGLAGDDTQTPDRCRSQATVSVRAFLGHQQGREAARRLGKLSGQIQKLAQSPKPAQKETLPRIVAQMQAELWQLESTARDLRPLIARLPDETAGQSGEALRTKPLQEALSRVNQELNRKTPDATFIAMNARQIERFASDWGKNLGRISEVLCLASFPGFSAAKPEIHVGMERR